VRICAIGRRAYAALRGADGEARVVAALATSVYADAGGEMLWVGGRRTTLHARAVQTATAPAGLQAGDRVSLIVPRDVTPWTPAPGPVSPDEARALSRGAARLGERLRALGTPSGFGTWLLDAPLAFPFDRAAARANGLAAACAADDAPRAADAACKLIGLGPGLTPSGDDLVGGAFFARALLARAGAIDATAWRGAASRVRANAAHLTHPIAAALLGDLVCGEGWATLHAVAAALARGDDTNALVAARALTRLGHSSGWDVLSGFIVGARG